MRYTKLLILSAALINLSAPSFAASHINAGTTGAQILDTIPNARPASMGNAYAASAGNSGSVFYNPAGIALIDHLQIPLSQNRLFDGIIHEYLGLIYGLKDIKT